MEPDHLRPKVSDRLCGWIIRYWTTRGGELDQMAREAAGQTR